MMRGRKSQDKTLITNILPPCRICGEAANGFHYGVNTCGACKGFFRRSLARKEPYECIQRRLCKVGPKVNRRQSCPKCRYDKCITLGMSKEACKVGRYSLIKKSIDIKEVIERQSNPPDTDLPIFTNRRANGWKDKPAHTMSGIPSTSSSFVSPYVIQNQLENSNVVNNSFNEPMSQTTHVDISGVPAQHQVHPSRGTDRLIGSSSLDELEEDLTSNNFGEEYLLTNMVLHGGIDNSKCMNKEFTKNTSVSRPVDIPTQSDRDSQSPLLYTVLESTLNSKTSSLSYNCNTWQQGTTSTSLSPYRDGNLHTVSTVVEPDSSKIVSSEKKHDIVSGSKDEEDMRLKPLRLYVVDPDPMKYVLSIFEEFPFHSFEKKSLAPLLKLCYNRNEWVNEFFTKSAVKPKQIPNIEKHSQEPVITPTVHLHSNVSSEHSQEPFVQEPSYEAIEMDNLFEYIRGVHCRHYGTETSSMTATEKSKFLEMFHKICRLHESLLGTLNLIDEDKYYEVLKSTGVDVDKRREWFRCAFGGFDDAIARDSKFFRALPGVKHFSLKDRITLTKSTSLLYAGLKNYNYAVDFDLNVSIDTDRGVAVRLSTFLEVLPGFAAIYDAWGTVLKAIQELEITFEEFIVFKALMLIFPDYCEVLEDRELVTTWHNTYLNCMLHIVRKSHGSKAGDRFTKIVGILQTLKDVACSGRMKTAQMSMKEQIEHLNDGQDQPLLTEVWTNLPYQ